MSVLDQLPVTSKLVDQAGAAIKDYQKMGQTVDSINVSRSIYEDMVEERQSVGLDEPPEQFYNVPLYVDDTLEGRRFTLAMHEIKESLGM